MPNHPQLSVIIPTINEASSLPVLLEQLNKQIDIKLEIIIADGGSEDQTHEITHQYQTKFITTPKGRGIQMNQAAKQASSEWLFFLHADSEIETTSLLAQALIHLKNQCLIDGTNVAGHFSLHFKRNDQNKNKLAYFYYEQKTTLNRPQCFNGDQGLLITKLFFQQIGGFHEHFFFFEDQMIAKVIHDKGKMITLPGILTTSARRFENEGFSRRMILSSFIMCFYYINFKDFFKRAPAIYQQQNKTALLDMHPMFNLVYILNQEVTINQNFKRWYDAGTYIRHHIWQVFFFIDIWFKFRFNKKTIFLRFHDKILDRIMDNPVFNFFTGVVSYCWFNTTWLYFFLTRKKL